MSVSTRFTKTSPRSPSRASATVRARPSAFERVGCDSSMSQPAKMSLILPTPVDRGRRPRGCARGGSAAAARARSRGGSAVRRYAPGSPSNGRAITRPTACSPGEQPARGAAGRVQLLERHRRLVRGDLEDRVGRGVDDPLARALVLLAEPLDDLGARGGDVADHAAPRGLRERVEQVLREAVGIGREGALGDDARELPVADRRVLALRALEQPAGRPRAPRPAAGSPRAAARCRGRAPAGSAGCRPPTASRDVARACSSPRRRRPRRRAARPRRRRRAPR